MPPFPDAAAPLSQMESKSQKGAKWSRLYPRSGVTGVPTKHSLCPVLQATHTPTTSRTEEKPAHNGVHRQPSRAQLGGKDEVAMSWAGVRLAWVTQGSGHLPWDLSPGMGGEAAWEEGRCQCELGTSLLGVGGAGTPPIQTHQLALPGGQCPGQVGTVPSLGPRDCPHMTRYISPGSHECWGGWQRWVRNESVPVTGRRERRQAQS